MKKLLGFFTIYQHDILIACFAIAALLVLIPVFTYYYFASDLQSTEGIMNKNSTGLVLLDRDNQPFFSFYQGRYSEFVPLTQIPKITQQTILSAEDKEFYSHPGFSPKAMVAAVLADIKNRGLAYGGSTITQQLVKNSLLTSNKSFARKYQELILAQELERRYTKDQILEMYLNSVYFGEGAFGVEDAAKVYFGKKAQDLDLAQSSLLAALLPSPSALSPISGDLERAKKRQEFVLEEMVQQKVITPAQKDQAQKEKLNFNSPENTLNSQAPHFALMVRDQLIKQFGEEKISRSGFKVKTTIDLSWQEFAQQQVAQQVKRLAQNDVSNGAAVVIDPKNGEVRALVGSKDWYDQDFGKVNIITSKRPPGSSFKPIVYSLALDKKIITPQTILKDQPTTYKGYVLASQAPKDDGSALYSPQNYDKKFRGPVTVRRALSNSLNVPTVEVMSKLGVNEVVNYAHQLGVNSLGEPSNYGLSLSLGAGELTPLELTNVYAAFANNGEQFEPTLITQIEDKYGNVIFKSDHSPKKVIDKGVAYLIYSLLSDSQTRREVFGNALDNKVNAAVKTGTTESYKDAWTLGFTDSVAIGVWVGNNDNTPMDQVAGSLGAAPIFRALVEKFSQGPAKFSPPPEVVSMETCGFTIKLDDRISTQSGRLEYFLKGTEPAKKACATPTPQPQPTDQKKEEKKQDQPKPQDDKKDGQGGPPDSTVSIIIETTQSTTPPPTPSAEPTPKENKKD